MRLEALRLGMVSAYPPRRCGLAAYAAELGYALAPEFDVVVCAVDRHALNYPDEVAAVIRADDRADYRRAARILAEHRVDAVLIQHDAAVYGGQAGAYLLELTHELRLQGIPYLLMLHTMRATADPTWARTLAALAAGAARLTVFTRDAKSAAVALGLAKAERIHVLPAAVRGVRPAASPRPTLQTILQGTDRVLATVGFVAPSKGLEAGLVAFAKVATARPDVRYVIAGTTHPDVAMAEGEKYRARLQAMAAELALGDRISFVDAQLSAAERAALLARTEVYLAPAFAPDRTCSGSLAAAVVAGCPVVAGWHPFVAELLVGAGGVVVPCGDAEALAQALGGLLDDRGRLAAARRAALRLGRRLTWPALAGRYAAVVREVVGDRVPLAPAALPALRLPRLRLAPARDAIVAASSASVNGMSDAAGPRGGVPSDAVPRHDMPVDRGARLAVVAAGLLGSAPDALPFGAWTRAAQWGESAVRSLSGEIRRDWALFGLGALAHTAGVPAPLRERAAGAAANLVPGHSMESRCTDPHPTDGRRSRATCSDSSAIRPRSHHRSRRPPPCLTRRHPSGQPGRGSPTGSPARMRGWPRL